MTAMTPAEKERLQAQLLAVHAQVAEREPRELEFNRQFRRELPGQWVQPPLPGMEEWVR